MYKIGDKVETPHFTGIVEKVYESGVKVNGKMFPLKDIKPYRTAHEKLIEMGYELTKRTDYVFYRHDDLPRVTIYSDKTYSCSDTNLALSRILTQYLEEMEEKKE